jgi:hypothetical protein
MGFELLVCRRPRPLYFRADMRCSDYWIARLVDTWDTWDTWDTSAETADLRCDARCDTRRHLDGQ